MVYYLASPYSHENESVRIENYRLVSRKAAELVASGLVVVSPITYGHTLLSFSDMPSNWEFWKKFCISILDKCDCLVVYKMPGWDQSRGVQEEISYAKSKDIPVEFIEFE
jgi:hypothetical protein